MAKAAVRGEKYFSPRTAAFRVSKPQVWRDWRWDLGPHQPGDREDETHDAQDDVPSLDAHGNASQ